MQDFIKPSLDYIEQNLKTDITAEELAQMSGYSVGHYCRLFSQTTGLSVANYISKKRINYAVAELSSGRKAIDVVLEYGFDTYAGFYKAFVKMYGCSPTKYLTVYKNKNLTPEELEELIMDYNKIAEEAIKNYPIESKSIEFTDKGMSCELAIHNNTMLQQYKVIDDKNNIYILRLYEFTDFGPKYDAATERAIINSELEWVASIGSGTDILVPEPVKSIHGEYVTAIDGVYCLLIKNFKGDNWKRHYLSFASYEDMDKFGDRTEGENWIKVIAKLHKHASEWTPPAGFVRPSYDANNVVKIFPEIDNIKHDMSAPKVEIFKKDLEIIKSAGQKALERLKTSPIEKNNMSWGLIHANLIHLCFQIFNHIPYPSDYSDTIFGYYMADIARAFFFVAPVKREYFFELYSKYFTLPKDYVSQIETFYIIRWLEIFYFNMKKSNDYPPEDTELLADKEFGYYLNDEPFLLNKDKPAFFEHPFPWD